MNGSKTDQSSRKQAYQSYVLHIRMNRTERIRIGKLGTYSFAGGHYLYTGSARRALEARIRRHLAEDKNRHWHIDYLLDAASVQTVYVSDRPECDLARWVREQTGGTEPAQGFGSSDCTCNTHLLHTSDRPELSLPVHTSRSD